MMGPPGPPQPMMGPPQPMGPPMGPPPPNMVAASQQMLPPPGTMLPGLPPPQMMTLPRPPPPQMQGPPGGPPPQVNIHHSETLFILTHARSRICRRERPLRSHPLLPNPPLLTHNNTSFSAASMDLNHGTVPNSEGN